MKDLERFRAEFPITKNLIYFNHAAVAPIPNRTREAMTAALDDVAEYGVLHWNRWSETVAAVRSKAAELIGALPSEIAFIKNTSEGLAFTANGLDWKKGDRVVSVAGEFPANVYPWLNLQKRGVELDLVPQRDGRVDLQEVIDHLDARTKLLTISYVQFLSGFRVDLQVLGEVCRQRNIFFVVDAIQGLGVFPLDVVECGIDALAADGHKWLVGPEGLGIFYCSQKLFAQLEPSIIGWTSVVNWSDYVNYELVLRPDAARFECGTLNTVSIYGLGASLSLILEVGVSRIKAKVLALTDYLADELVRRGFKLLSSRKEGEASGIVSFSSQKHSATELSAILRREGVEVSPRCGWVRVSPHFYNTMEEVDSMLRSLPA